MRTRRLLPDQSAAEAFSVGAVNVLTGNFIYFDNRDEEIGPEHVMASGALPPAFPMVKIGTDYYWDGGIVSNTPLQHLLDQEDRVNTARVPGRPVFVTRCAAPRYERRARAPQGHHVFVAHALQHRCLSTAAHAQNPAFCRALANPGSRATCDERKLKEELSDLPRFTIMQLIYQQKSYEGHAKDHEFSATSMHEHWQSGYEDTKRSLKQRHWLELPGC